MTQDKELKVIDLRQSNYRDIVATLRVIAQQIEDGKYGEVQDCALVLQGSTLDVFHTGSGDAGLAHLLFAVGQRRLEHAIMNHYDE